MDRLISRRDVESIVGLSKSTLYLMIAAGTFPRPVRIGARAVRFRESEIQVWLDKLDRD